MKLVIIAIVLFFQVSVHGQEEKDKKIQFKGLFGLKLSLETDYWRNTLGSYYIDEDASFLRLVMFSPEGQLLFRVAPKVRSGIKGGIDFNLDMSGRIKDMDRSYVFGGIVEYEIKKKVVFQSSCGISNLNSISNERGFFVGVSSRLDEHIYVGVDYHRDVHAESGLKHGTVTYSEFRKVEALNLKLALVF